MLWQAAQGRGACWLRGCALAVLPCFSLVWEQSPGTVGAWAQEPSFLQPSARLQAGPVTSRDSDTGAATNIGLQLHPCLHWLQVSPSLLAFALGPLWWPPARTGALHAGAARLLNRA